jgi:ribosomal protein L27
VGKDYTIFATAEGYVTFKFGKGGKKFIHVLPENPSAQPAQ